MEVRASSSVAGKPVQSSSAIAMSERSARCMSMESSGVRRTAAPSTGERKCTPSSVMRRRRARLKTWKPPESVSIGCGQCMKRCKPPCTAMTAVPGRSMRWKVLARTICAPSPVSSSGRHRFYRAVGTHRHESRCIDGAVRRHEAPTARSAVGRGHLKVRNHCPAAPRALRTSHRHSCRNDSRLAPRAHTPQGCADGQRRRTPA